VGRARRLVRVRSGGCFNHPELGLSRRINFGVVDTLTSWCVVART
jgi:hypothetical protein